MIIPTEQLLNIPGIRVLSVKYDEDKIECQLESTQGYSMCHTCGQKPRNFTNAGRNWNGVICRCVVGK